MPPTKNLLVLFDPAQPESQTSDFLIPWNQDNQQVLIGLKSGKTATFGMVVYIGSSITEYDLFARLVDSGKEITSVDGIMDLLRSYVGALQSLKIGNVARIQSPGQVNSTNVELELFANSPSGAALLLPEESDRNRDQPSQRLETNQRDRSGA
jgi:hypothetical protein